MCSLYQESLSDTRVEHKGGALVEETSGEDHLMGGQDGKEGQFARLSVHRDADCVFCRSQKEEEAKRRMKLRICEQSSVSQAHEHGVSCFSPA